MKYSAPEGRAFCYSCWRPSKVCLCDQVQTFHSPIRLGILQHPDENKMPVNTARLLRLCMPDSSFLIQGCEGITKTQEFKQEVSALNPKRIAVLYPHPKARPLEELQGEVDLLLLLDGTWREAQKIWHHNQNDFLDYQLTAFTPSSPSRYRIRKEPSDLHVSSLEAAVIALRGLSGNSELGAEALHLFEHMVETQLGFRGTNSRHKDNRIDALNLKVRDRYRLRNKLFNISFTERMQWLSELSPQELLLVKEFALGHGIKELYSPEHLGIQAFAAKCMKDS